MSRARWFLALAACSASLVSGACTTTYTEADLEKEEQHEDAEAKKEMVHDGELIEEGGEDEEALHDQWKWLETTEDR